MRRCDGVRELVWEVPDRSGTNARARVAMVSIAKYSLHNRRGQVGWSTVRDVVHSDRMAQGVLCVLPMGVTVIVARIWTV